MAVTAQRNTQPGPDAEPALPGAPTPVVSLPAASPHAATSEPTTSPHAPDPPPGTGPSRTPRRVVVAITGASGAIYGIRALRMLRENPEVETHLVLTRAGRATISYETDHTPAQVKALADQVHSDQDLGAAISSGSFLTVGMLVAPCSIKTLSGIANSYDETLAVRAADVTLKERRRLVLMLRETPLHAGHLRLMSEVTASGAVVLPPVPAFYTRPRSLDEVVDHSVGRALDLLGVGPQDLPRWSGDRGAGGHGAAAREPGEHRPGSSPPDGVRAPSHRR